MDFIKSFPAEVTELILQFLSVPEILTATEVSPLWNDTIGSFFEVMKKIQVKVKPKDDSSFSDVKNIFIRSSRKYQHFSFSLSSNSIVDVIEVLSAPVRSWRTIHLQKIAFKSPTEFVRMMAAVEQSIEDIHIEDTKCIPTQQSAAVDNNLTFPKLKLLRMKATTFHRIFTKCTKLQELNMNFWDSSVSSTVSHLMVRNGELKKLELTTNLLMNVLVEDIATHISCKLTTLIAKALPYTICRVTPTDNQSLEFFRSQMETLETLVIEEWMGLKVLKLIFLMPCLKTLEIKGSTQPYHLRTIIDWDTVKLQRNKSIEKLSYDDTNYSLSVTKVFIDAAPNVKKLELYSVNYKIMQYLSDNLPGLRSLKLKDLFEILDINRSDLLPKLNEFKVERIFSNVEDQIRNIPNEERSNHLNVFMRSNYST